MSNNSLREVSKYLNEPDENSLRSHLLQLFMFNIFVTDALSLEGSNTKLKEKVSLQQETLQALGERIQDLLSSYYSLTKILFSRIHC